MDASPPTHLRNPPRQARSAARVELLLDVAEEVFEEVGYDAATTNQIAARADVPVGTLYRWFPDKGALAEALADRYLQGLTAAYTSLISDVDPGERIGDFIPRVMSRLLEETLSQRAMPALLVSAMVPGSRAAAGLRLREGLQGAVQGIIDLRVPGIPEDARNRTAEVSVTLAHLILAAAATGAPPERDALTAEYIDVLLAYLEAKFPSEGHPAWSDPNVSVKPVFPAPDRAARLSAT